MFTVREAQVRLHPRVAWRAAGKFSVENRMTVFERWVNSMVPADDALPDPLLVGPWHDQATRMGVIER